MKQVYTNLNTTNNNNNNLVLGKQFQELMLFAQLIILSVDSVVICDVTVNL